MANELKTAVDSIREYLSTLRFKKAVAAEDVNSIKVVVADLGLPLKQADSIDVELLNTSKANTVAKFLAAKYESLADEAREDLLDVTAKLDPEVRAKLVQDGVKVTEAVVSNAIRCETKHQSAKENETRLAELARILKGLSLSMEMRFRALEQVSNNERADRRDT